MSAHYDEYVSLMHRADGSVIAPRPKAEITQLPIQGLELRVSYSIATISTKAKCIDAVYQVMRTERFDAIVLREVVRNPTKLREKLQKQARNHFNMRYGRHMVSPHYFALPESITITCVEVVGMKQYIHTDAEIDRLHRLMSLP